MEELGKLRFRGFGEFLEGRGGQAAAKQPLERVFGGWATSVARVPTHSTHPPTAVNLPI